MVRNNISDKSEEPFFDANKIIIKIDIEETSCTVHCLHTFTIVLDITGVIQKLLSKDFS